MNNSRVANTKRNICWSFADYGISVIFQFVSRTIIIKVLGDDYLGLSSLFSSILQVLNMTELGFSSAVIFNLYKPIAQNDNETVCALLSFYRKVYRIAGIIIFILGLAISPFLRSLIEGDVPLDLNLYVLYYLYLLNTTVSYFVYAYKASLLNALQRMDLTKIAYSIVNISQCIFQILVLLIFRNYYLFVIGTILGTVTKNLLAAWLSKKYYPQYRCIGQITDETKNDIWKRVKGLLIGKISGVTYTTFDNIILSAMIGLVPVSLYNNYLVIYYAVANIIIMIRLAMQASVGNSIASESIEKNYKDVFKWQFMFSAIAIWCSTFLICLYQPFMTIWMGEERLLSFVDVIMLSMLLSISTVQHAFYLYLSGYGLWWDLKWPYILSTITNLILNVLLCHIWGISGIILATLIAQFVFGLIWQSVIIFRKYFMKPIFPYFIKQIKYFAIGILIGLSAYSICSLLNFGGITELLCKAAVCGLLPPICWVLAFRKTKEFVECRQLASKLLHRQ